MAAGDGRAASWVGVMGAGGSGCARRQEGARCPECPGAAWDGVTALGAPALAFTASK